MPGSIDNERFRKLLLSSPGTAIEILYYEYYRSLLNVAKYLTQDEDVSEDIVQETFIHVWQNHKQLGQFHTRSIQHYLVKVVKYKAITHYKEAVQTNNRKKIFLNGQVLNPTEPSVERSLIESEIRKEVRQLISTFPQKEKECLLMKLDEELTVDQIAARLNVSGKAVERSLTSANKRLRKYWINKNKK
jgi:RNA polymerase sigma factor (sigma-70 family)